MSAADAAGKPPAGDPSQSLERRGPVVVLTGAGISTAAGIPDFRSPGGVWDRFDPQEFTIGRFHADPDTFWARRARLIAAMDYLDAAPTVAHTALAGAVHDGVVDHVVTQNVDGLHAKAGTPADRLLEVHGNGARSRCIDCHEAEAVQETLARLSTPVVCPRCAACGGRLKPDVVLFGEPVHAMQAASRLVTACGTLVVAGSSLAVHPVAGLAGLAVSTGARLIILNREPTPYDRLAAGFDRRPLDESIPALVASWRHGTGGAPQ